MLEVRPEARETVDTALAGEGAACGEMIHTYVNVCHRIVQEMKKRQGLRVQYKDSDALSNAVTGAQGFAPCWASLAGRAPRRRTPPRQPRAAFAQPRPRMLVGVSPQEAVALGRVEARLPVECAARELDRGLRRRCDRGGWARGCAGPLEHLS